MYTSSCTEYMDLAKKNGLIKAMLIILLVTVMCSFIKADDEELSEPVSAFISTSSQIITDRKMAAPVYAVNIDRERILNHMYNMAIKIVTNLGSSDPKSFGNIVLQTYEYYPALSNHDLGVYASLYAIGRVLEIKGLLPDVNTAIEKANELIYYLQVRIDELHGGQYWKDYLLAFKEGADLFFKHNDGLSPAEFIKIFKFFSEQVLKAR